MYYGILLICALIFAPLSKKLAKGLHIHTQSVPFAAFQILRTMILVLLGYVLFRSTSMHRALEYFGAMFGLTGNAAADGARRLR